MRCILISILLISLSQAAWAQVPADKPAPADIPVVKTFGDLQKVKPLIDKSLKDWKKQNYPGRDNYKPPADYETSRLVIRVGVNADVSLKYEPMLIYCLVEGGYPSLEGKGRRLGPLSVELKRKSEQIEKEEVKTQDHSTLSLMNDSVNLFILPVCGTHAGEYELKIMDPRGAVLAQRTLTVREESDQQWFAWLTSGKEDTKLHEEKEVDVYTGPAVAGPILKPAYPNWKGDEIIWIPKPKEDAGKEKELALRELPVLIPEKPTEGFKAELKGKDLELTFKEPVDIQTVYRSLLARWWVNGKPVEAVKKIAQRQEEDSLAVQTRQVRFRMDFDPQSVGAKKGDRVELQVLWCPKEWIFIANDVKALNKIEHEVKSVPELPPPALTKMSNRVEFVVE